MGFTEVLTLIFIILKLTGEIDWSWWLVLLPELIAISGYAIWAFVIGTFVKRNLDRM
jgi:hypothetical protein